MSVEWFKKRAKEITKAMRNGDTKLAQTIGIKAPFDNTSLMVVQHHLVTAAGFKKWSDMLDADDDERGQAIAQVKMLLAGEVQS